MADPAPGEEGDNNPPIPKSYWIIFAVLCLFVARDFMNTPITSNKGNGREDGSSSRMKEENDYDMSVPDIGGPGSRLSAGKMQSGPTMKFMYW